jgi:hypothetical protein
MPLLGKFSTLREVSCNTSRKLWCTPGDMINAGTSTQEFGVANKSVKMSYLVSTVKEDTVLTDHCTSTYKFDRVIHFLSRIKPAELAFHDKRSTREIRQIKKFLLLIEPFHSVTLQLLVRSCARQDFVDGRN